MFEPPEGKKSGHLVNLDELVRSQDGLEDMEKPRPRKTDDEPQQPPRRIVLLLVMDDEGGEG